MPNSPITQPSRKPKRRWLIPILGNNVSQACSSIRTPFAAIAAIVSTSGKLIPTILITAYPEDGVRERALAAGVIGYLSKPFDENDLLACISSASDTRP
jgi:CheY-like chemotaxis protein